MRRCTYHPSGTLRERQKRNSHKTLQQRKQLEEVLKIIALVKETLRYKSIIILGVYSTSAKHGDDTHHFCTLDGFAHESLASLRKTCLSSR